jgi:hypothetical protein
MHSNSLGNSNKGKLFVQGNHWRKSTSSEYLTTTSSSYLVTSFDRLVTTTF